MTLMADAFFNVSAKLRRCAMLQAFMHATCVHVCIEVNVHVMQPTASVRLCVFFFFVLENCSSWCTIALASLYDVDMAADVGASKRGTSCCLA